MTGFAPPAGIMRRGAGVPASSLGRDGDFYENTTTRDIYAKVGGAWVLDGTITAAGSSSGTYIDPLSSTYGAVGDGVANDTAALQAALTAAAGRVLFLRGNKTFLVSSPLIYPDNCTILGEGATSVIKASAAHAGNVLQGTKFGTNLSAVDTKPIFRDFRVDGNRTARSVAIPGTTAVTGGPGFTRVNGTVTASTGSTWTVVVDSAVGFTAGSSIWLGASVYTLNSISGNTLTMAAASAANQVTTRMIAMPYNPVGMGIAAQASSVKVANVELVNNPCHGLYIQGSATGATVSNHRITDSELCDNNGGASFFVAPHAPDGQITSSLGHQNGVATGMILSADWVLQNTHPNPSPNSNARFSNGWIIGSQDTRMHEQETDNTPSAAIVIDATYLDITPNDIEIIGGRTLNPSHMGDGFSPTLLFRIPNTRSVSRFRIVGFDFNGPTSYAILNGPQSRLVTDGLGTTLGAKIQVENAADFDILGTATVGNSTATYTGIQKSTALLTAQASAGATSITVDSTTGFDASGWATLGNQRFSYTAKTATTLTGIPASSTGSIVTTVAPTSGNNPNSWVAQHYLTGITVTAGTGVEANNATVNRNNNGVVTAQVIACSFAGEVFGRIGQRTNDVFIFDQADIQYRVGAPLAGRWERGWRVYETDPGSAGQIGWVNLAGGTPGTWRPWGTLTNREFDQKITAWSAQTTDRQNTSNQAILTSGALYLVAITLPIRTVITNIHFLGGTTAAGTIDHYWMGLLDANRVWKAVSADNPGATWNAGADNTLALSSPFTTTSFGLHYLGLMVSVSAGSVPPVAGKSITPGANSLLPAICGNSDTGLTTPPILATTASAISTSATTGVALGGVS